MTNWCLHLSLACRRCHRLLKSLTGEVRDQTKSWMSAQASRLPTSSSLLDRLLLPELSCYYYSVHSTILRTARYPAQHSKTEGTRLLKSQITNISRFVSWPFPKLHGIHTMAARRRQQRMHLGVMEATGSSNSLVELGAISLCCCSC